MLLLEFLDLYTVLTAALNNLQIHMCYSPVNSNECEISSSRNNNIVGKNVMGTDV